MRTFAVALLAVLTALGGVGCIRFTAGVHPESYTPAFRG